MQTIEIPYGRGAVALHVEGGELRAVLAPKAPEKTDSAPADIVRDALQNPIASPRLSTLARDKKRVLVITSDHTRPMPSGVTLPILLAELRAENPACEVRILIATGMHRPTADAELRERFGDMLLASEQFFIHRSDAEADMADFGVLPSGGALYLNKLAAWADLVISEGFIEPHFFAGFSGGRKSILPGIASKRSVLYNHNARFIADPGATQGSLQDNPIHRDMLYAARQAKLAFILNVLLDEDKRIVGAVAGDPVSAHEAGCQICRDACAVRKVSGNIVFTSNGGYPLDQNLYQAVKGMTAGEACAEIGGVIVVCGEMADGAGGEDFFRWFAERDSPETVAREIAAIPLPKTRADQWEAQILARVLCHARCVVVTRPENRALVERMHMRWAATPDEALALARTLIDEPPRIVVIPNGAGVIVQ